MRAAVLHDGRVTVRETADPKPGPGQLLLRTLSCAICASDLHFMDHSDPGGDDPLFSGYDSQADIVMGHEFVGEVVGHGEGVDADKFPIGSRVTSIPFLFTANGGHIIGQHPDAPGGFGELLLVSEGMTRVVPDGIDDDAVALTDAFAVGEGYVRTSGITDKDVPVVVGARRHRAVCGGRVGASFDLAHHRQRLQQRAPRAGEGVRGRHRGQSC